MSITPDQIKAIRTEFARLKPARARLDESRPLTVREAIFTLAPTLEQMRRRGFELAELAEKLHDKGIEICVPTLSRYLNAWRQKALQKSSKNFSCSQNVSQGISLFSLSFLGQAFSNSALFLQADISPSTETFIPNP